MKVKNSALWAGFLTSREVSVSPQNQAPTASFSTDTSSGTAPLTVSFDASASSDPDGTITSYDWDFGDGQTGTNQKIDHTFQNSGEYEVQLRVTDKDVASTTAAGFIYVSSSA